MQKDEVQVDGRCIKTDRPKWIFLLYGQNKKNEGMRNKEPAYGVVRRLFVHDIQ